MVDRNQLPAAQAPQDTPQQQQQQLHNWHAQRNEQILDQARLILRRGYGRPPTDAEARQFARHIQNQALQRTRRIHGRQEIISFQFYEQVEQVIREFHAPYQQQQQEAAAAAPGVAQGQEQSTAASSASQVQQRPTSSEANHSQVHEWLMSGLRLTPGPRSPPAPQPIHVPLEPPSSGLDIPGLPERPPSLPPHPQQVVDRTTHPGPPPAPYWDARTPWAPMEEG